MAAGTSSLLRWQVACTTGHARSRAPRPPRLSSVRRRPGRVPPRGARARPPAQRHPGPDQLQAPQGRPPQLVHRPRGMAGHHQPASPDKRTVQPELSDCKRQFASEAIWGTRHSRPAPPGATDHREPPVSRGPHLAPPPRQHVALLQRQPAQTALCRPQEDPQRLRRQPRRSHRPPATATPPHWHDL